jgi:hypothetical protein
MEKVYNYFRLDINQFVIVHSLHHLAGYLLNDMMMMPALCYALTLSLFYGASSLKKQSACSVTLNWSHYFEVYSESTSLWSYSINATYLKEEQ